MRRRLSAVFIAITFILGVVSILATNNAVFAGFSYDDESKTLVELDNQLNELRAEYIRLSIDKLGDNAEQVGFVEIKNPVYVQRIPSFASR